MPSNIPKIQSAHAILVLSPKYILQLRDQKSNIAAAGQWSLFGGKKKAKETPLQAIKREVYEELSIEPIQYDYLWFIDYFSSFEKTIIRSWFFVSEVSSVWHNHQLREGQAVKAFRFKYIGALEVPQVMRNTIIRFYNMEGKSRFKDEDKNFFKNFNTQNSRT